MKVGAWESRHADSSSETRLSMLLNSAKLTAASITAFAAATRAAVAGVVPSDIRTKAWAAASIPRASVRAAPPTRQSRRRGRARRESRVVLPPAQRPHADPGELGRRLLRVPA